MNPMMTVNDLIQELSDLAPELRQRPLLIDGVGGYSNRVAISVLRDGSVTLTPLVDSPGIK